MPMRRPLVRVPRVPVDVAGVGVLRAVHADPGGGAAGPAPGLEDEPRHDGDLHGERHRRDLWLLGSRPQSRTCQWSPQRCYECRVGLHTQT